MKWVDFERHIKKKGIQLFSSRDIEHFLGRSKVATTFLIHRIKKQGYIESVRRGLYKLTDEHIPEVYLANKIYEPSYVSLEFALSYHRIIPETVYEITSVTTKATRRFETLGRAYSYRKIKKAAFTGYTIEKQKGLSFRIADPEKAFVDALYYRVLFKEKPMSRFNKKRINAQKALRYAALFGNRQLTAILKRTLL